jgi:hypothetical protein
MEDEFESAETTEEHEETTEEVETQEEETTGTETQETEEETPEHTETEDKKAPVIPRKAYEDEKRKRQALEAKVKEIEAKVSTPAPKEPQTIEEHFDVNPEGVLNYLDQQIAAARSDYDESRERELLSQKTSLVARGMLNERHRQTRESSLSKLTTEIYKAVPDFEEKKPALVALAKEYGLDEKEASDIFDPAVIGETAVRMVKAWNKIHAERNAGKTMKTKEVKTPTKVEAAGTGGFSNKNANHKQLERAKESGNLDDWAALLE